MDFLIAFHENNREKAQTIKSELTPAGCSFELLSSADTSEAGEFNRRLVAANRQVVLLVSDNLLKEGKCMYGGLEAIQQLSSTNRILPVVIDGEYGTEHVNTVFERVGDVIQYLNFWQDEYINLRQKRRHLEDGQDQEGINEALRVVRQVSSEIGEYLRHLRVVKHYSWEQVSANDWELFFRLNQFQEGYARLKNASTGEPESPVQPEPSPVSTEEEPTAVTPAAMEEEPEEIPPVIEWDDIPGIASLGETPGETPESGEEEGGEDAEAVSPLIKKLVAHAEVTEGSTDPVEEDAPAPDTEAENVEKLFDEAVSESEEQVGETSKAEEQNLEEPEEALAILENAQARFDQGDLVSGLNMLSQAVEDYPQSSQLRYHYAQALLKYAHNPREATLELEKLVQFAPNHVQAWYLLGELSEMGHQYRQARQYFEHSVFLQPDFPQGLYRLGLLLTTHFDGEEKTAARYFRSAYKADPNYTDAYYQFGVLQYERLGNIEKAVKALQKVLDVQPEHPFANYDLALIFHSAGETEKAYQYYQLAIANNPELQTQENEEAFYFEPAEPAAQEAPGEPEATEEPAYLEEKEQRSDTRGIVLITGATSGIGRAAAEIFAREGYSLVLTGRREDRLENIQNELREKYSCPIRILCFDVRDAEEVAEHLNELDETWRNIDILINNAGLAKGLSPIQEGSLHHWETMIDTNIKGLLYVTRVVTPWMVGRKKGQVINIGSIAGKEVYPKGNVYCATKFAVDGLTRAMRLDLHQHGIRVSQICPGHVEETEFALVRFDGDAERAKIYQDFKPLRAADVAEIILYIAQAPAHVNIQDVVVTGTQQASVLQIDRSGRAD